MNPSISEDLVAHIWQSGQLTKFVTDSREDLQVIHPGRFTHGAGGDFHDAVLLIGGQRAHGNIEVHVRASQWYSHRHHHDPRYNNTILHVTYWQGSSIPTMLQNGKVIPTISLSSFAGQYSDVLSEQAKARSQAPPTCPQATRLPAIEHLMGLLAAAGEHRFAVKADSFLKALEEKEPGQVLFEGLARALGYSQNSEAFEKLAALLTLRSIEHLQSTKETMQQSLILGVAGLLPSQRAKSKRRLIEDAEVEELEESWRAFGLAETMSETHWCFFRVRPDNFPTRRLVALSHLLGRYRKPGLLQGMLKLVAEAPEKTAHRWLVDSLIVSAQGYWANHCNFGVVASKSVALIGQDKAAEMVINVLLPFASAWSRIAAKPELEQKAARIYYRFPKPADNELTRYMKQQLIIDPSTRLSACHEQGLLHLFRVYCRYRDCTVCPMTVSLG